MIRQFLGKSIPMPPRSKRKNPASTAKVERQFSRALLGVAKHVGELIDGFPIGDPATDSTITHLLNRYSETIG